MIALSVNKIEIIKAFYYQHSRSILYASVNGAYKSLKLVWDVVDESYHDCYKKNKDYTILLRTKYCEYYPEVNLVQ